MRTQAGYTVMKGTDKKEEEQWLQAFMLLYEQAAPLIRASATLDADGLPGNLKSLVEANEKLRPILQSVKKMRKPKRKELRNIKKDFERALSICLKASESAAKFVAAEVRGDPEIAKRMRFGTMVGQTQLAASCYEQLSENMVEVEAALGKKGNKES